MSTAIAIEETLVHSRTPQQLQQDVKAGLLLLDYLHAEISLGRFAELMGMNYVQARDWLHQQGIPTMRQFKDHELEQNSNNNYRKLANHLGIRLSPDC
jgi:predicted HTH domain antitoxin